MPSDLRITTECTQTVNPRTQIAHNSVARFLELRSDEGSVKRCPLDELVLYEPVQRDLFDKNIYLKQDYRYHSVLTALQQLTR